VADVSRLDDVKSLAKNVESTEGILDGIFVNAGGPPHGTFEEITEADRERSFQLVLMSAVRLTREFLRLLERSETPSILYDTSTSVKQPTVDYILANSLRTAVIGMMRTLAGELGPRGIRVNAVCPGNSKTESMRGTIESSSDAKRAIERITSSIPLRRIGEPHEFGAVCAFLLSPMASYVHGVLLLVDGGLYRGMM
jgi:3-oxoacyl-[acyl-carrier protein] reductase